MIMFRGIASVNLKILSERIVFVVIARGKRGWGKVEVGKAGSD